MSVEAPVATVVADGGRGGFTRPALAVDIEAAEEADGGGVPEPGTELGALDDARLAELSGPGRNKATAGGSGGSLEPPGRLLTRLHTVCME